MLKTFAASTIIQGIPLSHIATGFSLAMFIFSIPVLFDPRKFRAVVEEFLNMGNVIMRIVGIIDLLLAFLVLNTYWRFNLNSPRTFMSVIGYILLIRGIMRIWFPLVTREAIRKILHKDYALYILGVTGFCLALILGYLGLWVY